ncbi:hypothetical protein LC605_25695 [Nostoc sp. CHAB 5836]|uniref:hypothetical protein n=1 Tax=Nostoc sp. CHAB 5836 TaxID=2780404 RepID=UPI001E34B600|nr:hypothetical protein [Nostoc sp. CHAB 5836]MCC5618417.1 hypothetical protein [Nostoc sp. CHAB 5836]
MNQLTEVIEIYLKECRENYVRDLVNQFVSSLESQGFELNEIVDGLTNYAYMNTDSTEAVCFLVKSSLSLRKADEHN